MLPVEYGACMPKAFRIRKPQEVVHPGASGSIVRLSELSYLFAGAGAGATGAGAGAAGAGTAVPDTAG